MIDKKKYLPTYEGCFICGEKEINPATLNLRFQSTPNGVHVQFTPTKEQQGYNNVIHGGIICALLDETIGWSVAVERKCFFVTGELNVRFLRPLPVGMEVWVNGRPTEHKSRYSIAEGEIIDKNGTVYAKATGKFFLMPDEKARQVNSELKYREDDIDVLS